MDSPIKLFLIYAREDTAFKDRIIKQLRPLKGLIEEWHDRHILPGERWDEKINAQLRSADIILLLISDDFFDSEYIQNTEIKNAFSRYHLGEVVLMPVIVRECVWEVAKDLSSLQALPENGMAISSWQNQDAALRSVAKGVQIKAEQIQKERSSRMEAALRQREEEGRQKLISEERKRNEEESRRRFEQQKAEEERQKQIALEKNQRLAEDQQREQLAWQGAWKADNIEAYEDYLNKFQPDPRFGKEALKEIKRLKRVAEPPFWLKFKQQILTTGGLILLLMVGWVIVNLFRTVNPSELNNDGGKENVSQSSENPNPSTFSDSNTNPDKINDLKGINFDAFQPVVSSKKNYVFQGEKYYASIFLGAFSTQDDNVSISVNGSSLPLKDGVAYWETTANSLGEKSFNVNINVKNPLTGEIKNYTKEFKYEVGQRAIATQLDKMNVFYIGVENPISVAAAGISTNDLKVAGYGVFLNKKGGGHFIVTATTPSNDARITVSTPGVSQTFTYRVKRIPDPTPMLGAKHRSKEMANGEFKAQGGIAVILESFDFDVRCEVVGFTATYLPKRQDPISRINNGARWEPEVEGMINKARPGDFYFFEDIKCKCPGDADSRNLGGLAFKIK